MPAGFNKFEYPFITNDFYGDGIPFGQVQSTVRLITHHTTRSSTARPSQSRFENNTNTNTNTTYNQPTNQSTNR